MYGLVVNLIMSVSGHPLIINEIAKDSIRSTEFDIYFFAKWNILYNGYYSLNFDAIFYLKFISDFDIGKTVDLLLYNAVSIMPTQALPIGDFHKLCRQVFGVFLTTYPVIFFYLIIVDKQSKNFELLKC